MQQATCALRRPGSWVPRGHRVPTGVVEDTVDLDCRPRHARCDTPTRTRHTACCGRRRAACLRHRSGSPYESGVRRSDAAGQGDGLDGVGAEGVYALAQQRLELLIPAQGEGEGEGQGSSRSAARGRRYARARLRRPPAIGRRPSAVVRPQRRGNCGPAPPPEPNCVGRLLRRRRAVVAQTRARAVSLLSCRALAMPRRSTVKPARVSSVYEKSKKTCTVGTGGRGGRV